MYSYLQYQTSEKFVKPSKCQSTSTIYIIPKAPNLQSAGANVSHPHPLTHNAGSHTEWHREKPQFAFSLIHQI